MSGYAILVEEAGFAAEKEPESGNGRTPEEKADGEGGLIFCGCMGCERALCHSVGIFSICGLFKKGI